MPKAFLFGIKIENKSLNTRTFLAAKSEIKTLRPEIGPRAEKMVNF
jgi:hypothetical protein